MRLTFASRSGGRALLVPGQLPLIDLWAKEPAGMYADQPWIEALTGGGENGFVQGHTSTRGPRAPDRRRPERLGRYLGVTLL